MNLPKEIFNAFGQAKVFNILDLRSSYYQLPLKESNKVKMVFWRIDVHGKEYLEQWQNFPFGLKMPSIKFQSIMGQVLMGFNFVNYYINCHHL
jgi:hypothetical protein